MRLKHVRVFGFKTFADRTEFSVDGGIVAVVGPNGCGKSNLVDAVLWGLGETNSRHLRAANNQDVIFNGSAHRKPVGFAEVSLTFDNEDRTLPIDASEVVITRRVTRGGDSDYSINRRPCRLRDIFDLMSDSGLGRTGYSIVGQKEIDSALAASAEDRRAWIDEAAGVQRYRARKIESLRRLESTQSHLARVHDILAEIESQREPLAIESDRAHRYKSIQSSLREVEVGLLAVDAVTARQQVQELSEKITEGLRRRETLSIALRDADESATQIATEISELELRMDELRARLQATITAKERAEAAVNLTTQRLQALEDQEVGLTGDNEAIGERITIATRELEEARAEANLAESGRDELETQLAGASAESERLRKILREIESKLQSGRSENQRRMKLRAEAAHTAERRRAAEREREGVTNAIPELTAAVTAAAAELAVEEEKIALTIKQISEAEARAQEARVKSQQISVQQNELVSRISALEGKRRGIESTIDSLDGIAHGARAVLEAAESGAIDAEFWLVASVIDSVREYALAVETALGGNANDLIAESEREAKRGVAYLKERRAGRATFQPISLMRPVEITFDLRSALSQRGVIGRASELVTFDSHFRPVVESLLGRILIVETLDDALAMARTRGWSRLVTLDGEVVHASGAVTGGVQSRAPYGIVQRRADLAELENELAEITTQRSKLTSTLERQAATLTELDHALRKLRTQRTTIQQDADDRRKFWRNLSDELKTTEAAAARLEKELGQLNQTTAETDEIDLTALEQERDEIAATLLAKVNDGGASKARLEEANARLQRAHATIAAVSRRLTLAKDEAESRSDRLKNLGPLRERIAAEREQHQASQAQAEFLQADLSQQLAEAIGVRQSLVERSFAAAEAAKLARQDATLVEQGLGQAEIARARAETKRAATLERLLDEYGLTAEDAELLAPNTVIPEDAVSLTQRLRRDLKSMGDVNLGAIEAYQRLTERFEELDAQRADVENGVAQVQATITELDELTRDRFLAAFEAVRAAFAEVYLSVMGGGAGELRLSDEKNVLESGIEIDITLPGKNRQPLTLLSGGERSLCATAFLFSLLKVKPSPLVILDEVDAPLDGRNVERFAALLQRFTKQTQFIVITHNPTTIEAAPVWLGVTMQEPGVSSLVPARAKPSSLMPDE